MRDSHRKSFYVLVIATPLVFATALVAGYCVYVSHQAKGKIDLRIEGDWPLVADEVLGFGAAKNSSTTRRHLNSGLTYTLQTDGRGARVSARGEEVPDQVDILTIGGSFSWGHGFENEATFTETLGRRFNVQVANFSYGSYGTVQSLQLLERNADLRPKVVIYGFITDHIRRNLSPCAPSYTPYCTPVSYVAFDDNGVPHIKEPVLEYSSKLGREYYEHVAKNSLGIDDISWGARAILAQFKRRFTWNYSNDSRSRKNSMRKLMKNMSEIVEKMGSILIVVYIPLLERGEAVSAPAELLDALGQGTVFIDLSDAVIEYYAKAARPLLRFERDGHPNKIAHELIAREIHQVLETKGIF